MAVYVPVAESQNPGLTNCMDDSVYGPFDVPFVLRPSDYHLSGAEQETDYLGVSHPIDEARELFRFVLDILKAQSYC